MYCFFFFFFKQKTAYEMRISDWSSDVCSSDLDACAHASARELFLQQAIQSIRIGLALRRTHGLADEEAEQLVLAGAIFGELAGILRHHVVDRGDDRGLVGDLHQALGIDDVVEIGRGSCGERGVEEGENWGG